tara:strand:+ start:957 stop:1094 length:138 start_codon:yes stop_codon:yes gene_type:complete
MDININDKLTDEVIDKLDKEMTKLKGIGLSDIDIYIIRLALELTN